MGIGSCGVHFVLHGDVRRHLRISGILMESQHFVADGKNATNRTQLPGNPAAGLTGQALVHPSHLCQIGESDQGLSARIIEQQRKAHVTDRYSRPKTDCFSGCRHQKLAQ
jgi:hypothetical protein